MERIGFSPCLWVVDMQPAKRLGMVEEPIVGALQAGHEIIKTLYDLENGILPHELEPVFVSGRPLALCGSVGFAAWAHSRWRIRPGAFPSEGMRPSVWLSEYGELALNHKALITTVADFNLRRAEFEERLGGSLFVKPADGGKRLCGTVLSPGRPLFDAHFSQHRRWNPLPDHFRLLVAGIRAILREWRFVIAGEEVVAGSLYKVEGALESSPEVEKGAQGLARTIARHPWRPAEVFVADIAETPDGFSLLELNTFGTSGLYECDLDAVVRSVSRYIR